MGLTFRRGGWPLMLLALAATATIYWSGLKGGFVYDDFSFIVGNEALKVTGQSLDEWVAAMMSFPSGAQQGRWLGMLSFAVNCYFTGMDPYGFKFTNLAIHLLNGLLLFLALRKLLALHRATAPTGQQTSFDAGFAAAAMAGMWLVLPINLTAVLYVSQRLECLSNTFVFLGLWWYLRARLIHWNTGERTLQLWTSLIVCTGVGLAVKESAVLLPLYTACVEFLLTHGRKQDGRRSRSVFLLYAALLLVPLVIGLAWLASWVDGTHSFGRSFDIWSRLLTEARVLVDYVQWTLLPSLDALTLYHDDIQPSRGLIDPPSTLACIVVIAGLIGAACWQRNRRPLFSLGVFWFFGGHLLTATIIPLMLAFEHRNYFPSVGLVLAGASMLALEQNVLRGRAIMLAWSCAFTFYALTTALRAQEWSDADRLMLSEAAKRPLSPGAQFERARLMVTKLRRPDGTKMELEGYSALEDGMHLPGAGTAFEQSLITFHAERHEPIDPAWWTSLAEKLRDRPPSMSDARVLANLNHCYIDGLCGTDPTPLLAAYDAALSHGGFSPTMLAVHAEFAWYVLDDRQGAERDLREASRLVPFDVRARRNLVVLLLAVGKLDDARNELDQLRNLNKFGILDSMIKPVEDALHRKLVEENRHER